MAMNKMMFEEKWKVIRGQSTARWSLIADFDLNKVDKTEDKYHRFVTMLQVKYGYTRQQARLEVNKFWMEYEAAAVHHPGQGIFTRLPDFDHPDSLAGQHQHLYHRVGTLSRWNCRPGDRYAEL